MFHDLLHHSLHSMNWKDETSPGWEHNVNKLLFMAGPRWLWISWTGLWDAVPARTSWLTRRTPAGFLQRLKWGLATRGKTLSEPHESSGLSMPHNLAWPRCRWAGLLAGNLAPRPSLFLRSPHLPGVLLSCLKPDDCCIWMLNPEASSSKTSSQKAVLQ